MLWQPAFSHDRGRATDLGVVQDDQGSHESPYREALFTLSNIINSACFVAQLVAAQCQSNLQAHSGLLWGLTVVSIILAQPLIINRAIQRYTAVVHHTPREDGISSLEMHIKQLDLYAHLDHDLLLICYSSHH